MLYAKNLQGFAYARAGDPCPAHSYARRLAFVFQTSPVSGTEEQQRQHCNVLASANGCGQRSASVTTQRVTMTLVSRGGDSFASVRAYRSERFSRSIWGSSRQGPNNFSQSTLTVISLSSCACGIPRVHGSLSVRATLLDCLQPI